MSGFKPGQHCPTAGEDHPFAVTQREVAKRLGLTPGCVDRIEKRALQKLRAAAIARGLLPAHDE